MEEKLSLSPEYHHLPRSYIALLRRLERRELEGEMAKDKEKTERGFSEKIAEFKKRYQDSAAKHPALKRQDRLGKEPFAGFGTVVEDITESGYTKNQPILLGPF